MQLESHIINEDGNIEVQYNKRVCEGCDVIGRAPVLGVDLRVSSTEFYAVVVSPSMLMMK